MPNRVDFEREIKLRKGGHIFTLKNTAFSGILGGKLISGESDLQLLSQNEEINRMDKLKKHIYDESNGLHYALEGDY